MPLTYEHFWESLLTRFPQSVQPMVMRRLMRELTELKKSPPEGIRVQTSEDNMLDVTGIIEGPGEDARPTSVAPVADRCSRRNV